MSEQKIDVRVIQLEVTGRETQESRVKRAIDLIYQQKGADLILLPEMWKCGFHFGENYYSTAEFLDGPTIQLLSKAAKDLGAYIFGGSIVTWEGEQHYNTSLLFDREGRLISHYHKMHLFGYRSIEAKLLDAGDQVVVADTDFGRVGLSTCYDLRFPEQYRAMLDLGARIFLVTADWPEVRAAHWRLFNQVRAMENQCFVISCNAASNPMARRPYAHCGQSMVVAPDGTILAEAQMTETVLSCVIDPAQVKEVRENFPVLKDRVSIEGYTGKL